MCSEQIVKRHVAAAVQEIPFLSGLEILESSGAGMKCKYQGVPLHIDREKREWKNTEGGCPVKSRRTETRSAVDVVCLDPTGPSIVTVYGQIADEACRVAEEREEAAARGHQVHAIFEFDKLRITDLPKNHWNGEMLTRVRTLQSIEAVGSVAGTTFRTLPHGTAPSFRGTFTVPSVSCCITNYQSVRDKLCAPFRGTFKGILMDVSDLEYTQSGNPKRNFHIVDRSGFYMVCCALKQNASSLALQNFQEVILYYVTGRGPIGGVPGMLYLMKDAVVVPIGAPRLSGVAKRELLNIA